MSGENSGGGWMPIETAPKDQEIDLWIVPRGGGKAFRAPDCAWRSIAGEDQWVTRGDKGWEPLVAIGRATHWMPLPAPPPPSKD